MQKSPKSNESVHDSLEPISQDVYDNCPNSNGVLIDVYCRNFKWEIRPVKEIN